jgi:putative mRNA 3-end processing factor
VVYNNGLKILLDPRRESEADVMFFSHAHSDHLITARKKKIAYAREVLASRETICLAQARGVDLSIANYRECSDGYDLIDTCHVVESTFGLPRYVFPPVDDIVHMTNKIIGEMFDRGVSVILMGYPLGKAQLLTKLFQHWAPLFIHDSVAKINSVYRDFGVGLKECTVISNAKQEEYLLEKSVPWVMIVPLGAARSGYIKTIKERYRAVTIGFSGWAIDNSYKFMMGLDYALPLSDHCDYEELVQLVLLSGARTVYTFHGFAEEFARSLRGLGLDAKALTRRHRSQQESSIQIQRNGTLDLYL